MELQQLNNKYTFENSSKNFQKALRKLTAFLGKPEWVNQNIEVLTPLFNLPIKIDERLASLYAHRNSPFALAQEQKRLKAEQTLFR